MSKRKKKSGWFMPQDGCFQPYIHEKTLVLPHQEMCFSRYYRALTVFDQNGRLQYVNVAMCNHESEVQTLLQLGLWGATPTKPQTAFSVSLLEWLVWLSKEDQVSTEAFCRTVRWKNNLTRKEFNTLYRALTGECISEFRHLKHRLERMKDVSDGIICPACPKNDGEQYIAIDANFSLVRKESLGVSSGPPLHGESVFLDDGALVEFLNNYYDKETPPDVRSCRTYYYMLSPKRKKASTISVTTA
ncbi:PREDICTED: uncharacterized protein LOC109465074 [Branchiostoma belcheri]|uniref:Uncharacterized protein LOC109465074 n=1 Tax=Branchiostoma belcheri TaxID=7741 RepID=A0A6P4Y5Y4_BRABE|nr:PREDICTED: uncharacterized protein LOC109465074 [Branchiostoma belcheri]